MQAWTAEELRQFLEHVRDDRLYALWLTAATTRMRRGELLGLRWSDVDLTAGLITIRQTLVETSYQLRFSTPKADSSRTVTIDAETVAALRRRQKVQQAERAAWKLRLGEDGDWPDYGGNGPLCFVREDGSLIHPQSIYTAFRRHAKKAGVRMLALHGLRHTMATLHLQAGQPLKLVSDRLGHSSISVTAHIYSHVTPEMQSSAAGVVSTLIARQPETAAQGGK